jgi:hypothetical protein
MLPAKLSIILHPGDSRPLYGAGAFWNLTSRISVVALFPLRFAVAPSRNGTFGPHALSLRREG